MPSRNELLASIRPDMKLTKGFLKRIYGYELTWPGFADQAITALEAAGCSQARGYYETWVNQYKTARDAEIKSVAASYLEDLKRGRKKGQKEGERVRTSQQQMQKIIEDLHQKSDRELLSLLQSMN